MIIYLPLLVCIIGLIVYSISANPKAQAIGLDMFWVGLFVTLLSARSLVSVLR